MGKPFSGNVEWYNAPLGCITGRTDHAVYINTFAASDSTVGAHHQVYKLNSVGNCGQGRNFIYTQDICNTAAAELGYADSTSAVESHLITDTATSETYPFGCYAKGDQVYFNPDGDRQNDASTRLSLCIAVDDVAHDEYSPICLKPATQYSTIDLNEDQCSCGTAVSNEQWCRSAATTLGVEYKAEKDIQDFSTAPPGCIVYGGNNPDQQGVFFNEHSTGADGSAYALVCSRVGHA